jgi:hypothetical protein
VEEKILGELIGEAIMHSCVAPTLIRRAALGWSRKVIDIVVTGELPTPSHIFVIKCPDNEYLFRNCSNYS